MDWTDGSMRAMNANLGARGLSMNRIYAVQAVGSLVTAFALSYSLVFASTYPKTSRESFPPVTGSYIRWRRVSFFLCGGTVQWPDAG